jgi:hypothetical protein
LSWAATGPAAARAPFDLDAKIFERHAVYLSNHEVVFVFEGRDVESGGLTISPTTLCSRK